MTTPRKVLLLIERDVGYRHAVLKGIFEYLRQREGWSCEAGNVSPDGLRILRVWKPDGIIAALWNRPIAEALFRSGLPMVDVFNWHSDIACARVSVDDDAVGAMAARFLIDSGFRRLGLVQSHHLQFAMERRQGFTRVAIAEGIPVDLAPPISGNSEVWGAGKQITERNLLVRWIDRLPKPIAIFAMSDAGAVQVIEACRMLNVNVPDQVSVLGCDNDELLCHLRHPPISSIELGEQRVGYRAAVLLDDLMAGNRRDLQVRLPPVGIIERTSTNRMLLEDADITAALKYIAEHAHQGIHVEDIVAHVIVPRRTLQRRFCALVGHSLQQEIMRARLKRGCHLLTETDLTVPQVAQRCGFAGRERFWSAFRKEMKISPLEYRLERRRLSC